MLIKWVGRPTHRNWHWNETAHSYRELYEKLVDREIITRWDIDPWEKAIAEKYGRNLDEFYDEEDNYTFYDWYESEIKSDLTEEEYKILIISCNGNAYYQEFEEIEEN